MVHERQARRFSAVAALTVWLGLGLALPIVLSLYSFDIVSDAVEAAPSDAFTITEPVTIVGSPNIRIERGTIALVDGQGRPVSLVDNGPGSNPVPAGHSVRLFNATIVIGGAIGPQGSVRHRSSDAVAPVVEALAAGRYETLSLRRTTATMSFLGDAPETITDVKAEVSLRRRGLVAVKGSGVLRGQPITLDATANTGQIERSGPASSRLPIKLSLKGTHLDLGFDGRLVTAPEEIGLQGQGELTVPSIRQAARWFGAHWPSGPGLRNAAIRGDMSLTRNTLTFENASARMDGNEATGVLAMRVGAPRPVVTGTLAYKVIDTKPYFAGNPREAAEPFSWSTFAAGVLTVPLGLHLDADLRISADKVVLGGFELGRSAATIALKDGRLLADLAELKFNGGEGGGQITADFTRYLPKFTLRGKLDRVDLGPLSSSLTGRPIVQGQANVVADIAGTGATLQDVFQGLAGKFAVRLPEGVRVGLDLRALATAARTKEVTGWDPAARGSTNFDQMDLRLVLRDGTVLTQSAEARSADGTWSATGVVNLLSNRIDVRLTQSAGSPAAPAANVAAPQAVLELHGPMNGPSISAGTDPERPLPR